MQTAHFVGSFVGTAKDASLDRLTVDCSAKPAGLSTLLGSTGRCGHGEVSGAETRSLRKT